MGLSRDLALALLSLSRSSLWSVTRTWKKTRKRLKKRRDEQEVGHLLPSLHFRRCKHTGWMRHPFHPWKTLKPQVYPAVSGLLSKNFVELFAQANIEIPKPAMPKLQLRRRTAAYVHKTKYDLGGARECGILGTVGTHAMELIRPAQAICIDEHLPPQSTKNWMLPKAKKRHCFI